MGDELARRLDIRGGLRETCADTKRELKNPAVKPMGTV